MKIYQVHCLNNDVGGYVDSFWFRASRAIARLQELNGSTDLAIAHMRWEVTEWTMNDDPDA